MSPAPRVAVSGPDRGGFVSWVFLALAVLRARGRPLRVRPSGPAPGAPGTWDALILAGGADVDPGRYGQRAVPRTPRRTKRPQGIRALARAIVGLALLPLIHLFRRIFSLKASPGPDPARDALEERLLTEALARGVPILGICRGMQFLNVHLGGSLHQDLAALHEERPELRTILPQKPVRLAEGSRLRSVLGTAETRVNALHHQAVDRLGQGLRVAARDLHDVIQGLELDSEAFVLGVQWHPEYLVHQARQQALFRTLVLRARQDISGQ